MYYTIDMISFIKNLGGFFLLHFILAAVSKLVNQKVYQTDNFFASWGKCTSLLFTYIHFSNDAGEPYSHSLMFEGFGGKLGISFGHSFREDSTKPKFFGFHSTDGELLWNNLWFYNPFTKKNTLMESFLDTTKVFLQGRFLDVEFGEMIDEPLPVKVLEDTNYYGKEGAVQHINKIEFYVMERIWTSTLAQYLHLQSIFNTTKLSMGFQVYGDEGLGEMKETSGLISLTTEAKEAIGELLINKTVENKKRVMEILEERIAYFMMLDKNY